MNKIVVPTNLPDLHRNRLEWFLANEGQTVGWPIQMPSGELLSMKAKGIYKPSESPYALSVKQSLGGPYADREPVYNPDGSWTYLYYQEEQVGKDPEELHTNKAMRLCMRDQIPIGVLRQLSPKPNVRYKVLGLAYIIGKAAGYYLLEGGASTNTRSEYFNSPVYSTEAPTLPSVAESKNDMRIHRLQSIVQRQGQAKFREELMDVYERKCAISSCDVADVLEACHILPYRGEHTNSTSNGIILRADFHILFDEGLLAVEPYSLRAVLAPQIRHNRSYERFHGADLHDGAKEIEKDYLIAHQHYCGF